MTQYVLICFAYSYGVWFTLIALAAAGRIDPQTPAAYYAWGGLGPLIGAVFVTAREGGLAGVRRLLRRGLQLRAPLRWYAFALLSVAATGAAGVALHAGLSGGTILPPPFAAIPALLVVGLLVGVMEEYGWRGLALPRRLERVTATRAALEVGLLWFAWHLPLFWIDGTSFDFWRDTLGPALALGRYLATVLALSILMTFAFCRTRGNLFVAGILFHAAANTGGDVFTGPYVRAGDIGPSLWASLMLAILGVLIALRLPRRCEAPAG